MRQLLSIILTLVCLTAYGQSDNFTGKIIYEYQFLNPATGEDVTNIMEPYFGQEQHYFVNALNYKAYDEDGRLRQLYNSQTNTYYFLNPSSGQLMELDAASQTSKVISVEHSEETKEILGKECKKLVITTDSDETTYWYSPTVAVNPKTYVDHKFGNWDTFMNESEGALPLEFTVKSQNYTMISTAIDLETMDLTQEDFNIASETEGN